MVNEPNPSLSPEQAAELLPQTVSDVRVEFLRPFNHTWRVVADGAAYYVKVHTKPWYGGKPAGAVVRHEVTAHRLLREHGLATPDVVRFDTTAENALGWPYLLTRELRGTALTDLLPQLTLDDADVALREVGTHLARIHAITFEHPGYLMDGPPPGPPDPDRWQHDIWRFERHLAHAFVTWSEVEPELDLPTMDGLCGLAADKLAAFRTSYQPPRFVHGDCHASQFFLVAANGGWQVTGVLDMEVSSAGSPLSDFLKFSVEMAGRFRAGPPRWWEPFLAGYGRPVDFDLLRLVLTTAGHVNYTCLGPDAWPGTRAQVVRHLVRARNWEELFDLTRIDR